MNKFKYFILPAIIICCAVIFTGCSDDDDDNNNGSGLGTQSQLVGTWHVVSAAGYEIDADGTNTDFIDSYNRGDWYFTFQSDGRYQ